MKILMLGWELPPFNSGGLGVACLNIAKALTSEGAEIDFVLPYTAKHEGADFMNIISATSLNPIHRFGNGAYESKQIEKGFGNNYDSPIYSIRGIQKEYCDFVREYLKTNRPDVVHAHDWLTFEAAMIAKKEFNLPFIAHMHATEFDRAGMLDGNPLIHSIESEGLRMADRIFAVSKNTRNIIHKKYHIPLKRIEVTYNSLDNSYEKNPYIFNSEPYQYFIDLKNRGYTIVSTVGRFTIQKGLQYLMRSAKKALKKNPKLMFIFVGDGEERDELIKLATKLDISENVIFTGFIRGKKLKDVYSLSDIFVMSSVSEPFGLTALEAACQDTALILTKQSGVSEVLFSCLKYDYWDENKLTNEILAIAGSEALQKALKKNSKQEYQKIKWQNIAKKCLDTYNEVEKKD